ncbi:hypothetical protein [Chitiniphilus eburneus]|uniref:Type 4a pilus biogenesis protein PilO n=1 Tax=Chitiniphilus eburneus TaxID=2571148 RepID=A0A4U0QCH8_9NEIS|nr:hypothetical protein [Chitiniphilus eburneus]TJZ79117.1 hypothetical protein FAZ21_02195 [Chitiniphilus eburneus]
MIIRPVWRNGCCAGVLLLGAAMLALDAQTTLTSAHHANDQARQGSVQLRLQAQQLAKATRHAPRLAELRAMGLLEPPDESALDALLDAFGRAHPAIMFGYRLDAMTPLEPDNPRGQALPFEIEFQPRHEQELIQVLAAVQRLRGRPLVRSCELTRSDASDVFLARCTLVRLSLALSGQDPP